MRLRDAVLAEQDFGLFDDPDLFTSLATIDDGDGQQLVHLAPRVLAAAEANGDNGEQIIDELPHADSIFQEGDVVLVLGNEDRISQFERTG